MFEQENDHRTNFEIAKDEVLAGRRTAFSFYSEGKITLEQADELNDLLQQQRTGKTKEELAEVRAREAQNQPDPSVNYVPDVGDKSLIEEGVPEKNFIHTYGGGAKTAELTVTKRKDATAERIATKLFRKLTGRDAA